MSAPMSTKPANRPAGPGRTPPAFVHDLLGRSDNAIIGDIVSPGARVLDPGCGEGELLQWLASN